MKELIASIRPALMHLLVFTGLLGFVYPAVMIGVGYLVPHPAPSELVGQPFDDTAYFWGRPSAISYVAASSSGTNLGPGSPALKEAVAARIKALKDADPPNTMLIPVDLVTSSASGLDPDISPAAAYYQAGRVARLRATTREKVIALVDGQIEERFLGVLGERRVNVVRLNRALDATFPRSK